MSIHTMTPMDRSQIQSIPLHHALEQCYAPSSCGSVMVPIHFLHSFYDGLAIGNPHSPFFTPVLFSAPLRLVNIRRSEPPDTILPVVPSSAAVAILSIARHLHSDCIVDNLLHSGRRTAPHVQRCLKLLEAGTGGGPLLRSTSHGSLREPFPKKRPSLSIGRMQTTTLLKCRLRCSCEGREMYDR
jgi:hypothetical protein